MKMQESPDYSCAYTNSALRYVLIRDKSEIADFLGM